MSTYLQLCARLRQEVRAAGTGPTAVTGQVGEYKRLVDWIATCDEDIQRHRNQWRFMRKGFTVSTVASDNSYASTDCTDTSTSTVISNFRDWVKPSFKIYEVSVSDESPLEYIDYQTWYEQYATGTQITGRPQFFTIGNDLSIKLAPVPNDVYVVSGEYQKSVTTMTANADVPLYPSEYHMLPVWKAMMDYGYDAGGPECVARGTIRYNQMMHQMEMTQLPEMLTEESWV